MHSIAEIRAEFDRLDKICGVDSSGIEIKISHRSGRRLGSFCYPLKAGTAPLKIIISSALLEQEELFWDTIRHEYAHAVLYLRNPGEKHGHDRQWRELCRQLGCSAERLAPQTEESRRRVEQEAKYRIHCKGCGRDSYYFRAGKTVKAMLTGRGAKLRCTFCGGERFELYVRKPGLPGRDIQ